MADFETLWGLEQQLIACIDEIKTLATTAEGSREITWREGASPGQDSVLQQSPAPRQSRIILPGSANDFLPPPNTNNNSGRRQQFMGGSLRDRIAYIDENSCGPCARDTSSASAQKNNLAFEERLISSFISSQKRQAPSNDLTTKNESGDIQSLRLKAHGLSCQIFEKRQTMGLKMWLCDQTSAKDINIKIGGDGTFKDQDGNIVLMPDAPLSKTCLGRKGRVGDSLWIMECVLCPVNYIDNDERFIAWQKHFDTRKDARLQNTAETATTEEK